MVSRIREARGARHLLLLLDFDGTVCELASHPDEAVVPEAMAATLRSLDARDDITLGFVSGRRASDLRRRLPPLPCSYIAGCHGLEIEAADVRFVPAGSDDAADDVQAVGAAIAPELVRWPGTFLEDKNWSVALHVRNTSAAHAGIASARFRALAAPAVTAGRVRLLEGACVTELLPALDWHKGSAVTWIRDRVELQKGPVFCVFAGDDITDDDAFRALGANGLSVAVSSRPAAADCRLPDPDALGRVLQMLP